MSQASRNEEGRYLKSKRRPLITLAFSNKLLLLPWLAMLYCCKVYSSTDVYVRAHSIDYVHLFINAGPV